MGRFLPFLLAMALVAVGAALPAAVALSIPAGGWRDVGLTLTGTGSAIAGTEVAVTITSLDSVDHIVILGVMGAVPPAWQESRTASQTTSALALAAKQTYSLKVPGGAAITLYLTATNSGTGTLYAEVVQ